MTLRHALTVEVVRCVAEEARCVKQLELDPADAGAELGRNDWLMEEAILHDAAAKRGIKIPAIETEYDPPPAPIDGYDWRARFEDDGESGPTGWGSTKEQAIRDLVAQYEESLDV